MTHKTSTYILLAITALFIGVMIYNGLPATLDKIATWRNGGMPTQQAECIRKCQMVKAIDGTKMMKDLMK